MMRNLKISKQVTDRNGRSIEAYLREVAMQPMVSAEEETLLAKKIKAGDTDALQKLVRANLRFAISVAKQYQHHGLPLEDLISEANIGLIKGAERFDETRGFKFISYAVWWIRQSILKAISEKSRRIRLPINKTKEVKAIVDTALHFEQEHEREPSDYELGELVRMMPYEIREILGLTTKSKSIDESLTDDEEGSEFKDLMEDPNTIHPTHQLDLESLTKEIDRLLATLPDKESAILRLSFGIGISYPMSLEDIGKRLDMSKERVRQLREKGLRKLRGSSRSKILRSFFNGS